MCSFRHLSLPAPSPHLFSACATAKLCSVTSAKLIVGNDGDPEDVLEPKLGDTAILRNVVGPVVVLDEVLIAPQINIALGRIPVPAKHRVNSLCELGAI